MRILKIKKFSNRKILSVTLVIATIVSASLIYPFDKSSAAALTSTSVQLSDPRPYNAGPPIAGDNVTYKTTFTTSGSTSIQCMKIVFKDDPTMAGSEPSGMVTTGFAKGTITGGGLTDANWSSYNATDGTLQFEYAAGGTTSNGSPVVITATGIRNTTISTFYGQITTYATLTGHVCSSPVDTSNIMGLVTTGGVTASVTVQNTLALTIANYASHVNGSTAANNVVTTSSTIPFGAVAAGSEKYGAQTATVSTNAAHGYNLYLRDTQALTNLSTNTIADITGTTGAPVSWDGSSSQSRFGFTVDGTSAVSLGSNKWAGLTQTNTSIATDTSPISNEDTNVEYRVAISNTQPPGDYSNVITYTLTPTY